MAGGLSGALDPLVFRRVLGGLADLVGGVFGGVLHVVRGLVGEAVEFVAVDGFGSLADLLRGILSGVLDVVGCLRCERLDLVVDHLPGLGPLERDGSGACERSSDAAAGGLGERPGRRRDGLIGHALHIGRLRRLLVWILVRLGLVGHGGLSQASGMFGRS